MPKYTKEELQEKAMKALAIKELNPTKYNKLRWAIGLKMQLTYGEVEYKIIRLSEGLAI